MYKNRRMKPVEIVLSWGEVGRRKEGRTTEGINIRYFVSIYVNIVIYLLYNYYMQLKNKF
jgi:hypothetical protein